MNTPLTIAGVELHSRRRHEAMSFEAVWHKHDFRAVADRIAGKNTADVQRGLGRGRGTLTLDDLAALLSPAAAPFLEEMAQPSHQRTVERFGRTIQMYAPLYLSNVCGNICTPDRLGQAGVKKIGIGARAC
jgi:2-iminoacetate synthase